MLISEVLSDPGIGNVATVNPLRRIERLVCDIEQASPGIGVDTVEELQECVLGLKSELSEEQRLQIWKLSYRIWNTCVDIANSIQQQQPPGRAAVDSSAEYHARLRQIASEMLFLAGAVGSIRSSTLKMATFFLRSGTTWHKIRNYKSAAGCFERATEIVSRDNVFSSIGTSEEQQFMFDLCLARSRTAWEMSHKALASSLLGRARGFLQDSLERYQELADVYLLYGKSLLALQDSESKAESVKYVEQAYEICSEALKGSCKTKSEEQTVTSQKLTILRYIAAGQLQNGNFEGVLKCVSVLKGSSDHPSTSFLAFKALLGLSRFEEAEEELIALISHDKAAVEVCLSALTFLIEETTQQLDVAKKAFFVLLSRFSSTAEVCASIIEKLLKQASPTDPMSRKRVEVALSIATDDRVLKRFNACAGPRLHNPLLHCRKELESMHALLWNCGSDFFQAKDYPTAIRLFEAAMHYLPAEEETTMRAKALRVLCLCYLGLLQYDRAAEYVDAAEKLEPNVSCSFLKFKICLQINDEVGAANQVSKMIKCADFEPEYLTLASHEAVACKNIKVAVSALSNMLVMISSNSRPPAGTKEVTVFRNLIFLALQDLKCQDEAVKYLKQARQRLQETGAETFLGSGSSAEKEASWFAGCAWNQGLAAAKTQDWKTCEELFACASDFYALLSDTAENLQSLETSLLLTVAALLMICNESDTEKLKLATVYMEKCRKVHASLLLKSPTFASTDFYMNLLAFDLKGKMKEYKEQLEIMYRCASLPGFKPDYFFKMAMHACNGDGSNTEVPIAAFKSCLNLLLSSAAPDYKRAAVIMRKLIVLSDQRNKDGPEVLKLYREAKHMLLGLQNGVYPSEEIQWLVSTAWNRAALQVKLSRLPGAEQWMNIALELLSHAPAMEPQRQGMVDSLNEVMKQKQGHVDLMEE
ncbi:TPR repeat-containing protein ZIP4 [Selaginella moellendorffii]|uniref:TPR repeat-containing protein ZIP4 n=1 Tax=Selaginella moellendorffii TaxID=88036 RepID=UPI000D1C9AB2|nr:TPR repeat-containing protein ZIP4 [Selaginella moellendorffii]|eukprot:XP_024540453.1 TPR repeat-containing protein ZIP4 [Selaginella moellendorffii]